ncbi:phage tail protein [[Haemophilus] felis]|nr:phage tail protein [[Haemophilus] felis]
MSQQYYAILTDYGSQQLAQAIATHQPLNITHFAVGDGNGRETSPNPRYTALVQEVYRANISAVSKDPRNNQQVIFELTIPENVGGFYIREMGIFDAQNKLVGYANSPESFKPTEQSGSGKLQVIRMILRVSSSEAVQLTVDNSVIFASRHQLNPKTINASSQNNVDETGHSHQIAQASTAQAGITQLDNAINSNAEDRAATPKAVKQVNDKVESNARSLNERIPNSKKSDAVNSSSSDTVATSRAVKTAYDLANSKQSPATTLAGYGIADFQLRTATGNLNDYRTAGIYSINSIHNSHNRPAEGVRQSQGFTGNLQVITGGAGNESWCHQIFRRHYSGETYERWQTESNNNNWSEWKRTDNSQLAQNLQDKADRVHTHTVSQITDFAQGVAGIFAQNMGENGWTKLPNGLIIQWGRTRDSVRTLFNTAFPNRAFMLVASANYRSFDSGSVWTANIHNNREFTLFEGTGASEDYAYWFAIGH